MVAPTIQKVVSFHGTKVSRALHLERSKISRCWELNLSSFGTLALDPRAKAPEKLVEADAVWFINDPVVGKREAFEFLREETIHPKTTYRIAL